MSDPGSPLRPLPRVSAPCPECPWRRDQPAHRFSSERFDAMRETVAGPNGSAELGAPLFACHRSAEGRDRACAGWLAVAGADHVGVRIAVVAGRLDPDALSPDPSWPALYDDFDEMAAANVVPPAVPADGPSATGSGARPRPGGAPRNAAG